MPLEDQLSHDSAYMTSLCAAGSLDSVFCPSVHLLPQDLQKQIETRWAQTNRAGEKYVFLSVFV